MGDDPRHARGTRQRELQWQRRSSACPEAASARRARPTPPPDRSAAGPAWPEHHGVLQAFQRPRRRYEPGLPLPVVITAYADKSFTFIIKSPPATVLLKKAAKIDRGSPQSRTATRSPGSPVPTGTSPRPRSRTHCGRPRCRRYDHRRLRPLDGHHRGGSDHGQSSPRKRQGSCRAGSRPPRLSPAGRRAVIVKDCAGQVRRIHRHWPCSSASMPRKSDQVVRGAVVLPNGTGKTKRVAVSPRAPRLKARPAGADVVSMDDLAAQKAGNLNFDVVIRRPTPCTRGRYARQILGPRGLMPQKVGTVTPDMATAGEERQGQPRCSSASTRRRIVRHDRSPVVRPQADSQPARP